VRHPIVSAILGTALLGAIVAGAADNLSKTPNAAPTKVAFIRERAPETPAPSDALAASNTFIFSARPGSSPASDREMYEPIAALLSRATGKNFKFQRADNWLTYSRSMANGAYDLLFDGAPLNAWRLERMDHVPIVRVSNDTSFVTIVRADDKSITSEKQLAGKTICAHAPTDPEVAGLLAEFDNPMRQPVLVDTLTWRDAHAGLVSGKCAATVVSADFLDGTDTSRTRVINRRGPLPGYAFSAGPRISPGMQGAIRAALVSEEGRMATAKLRQALGNVELRDADPSSYAQLRDVLKNQMHFN
jgi:ABC-type phosphate/phosphonate transport system substrate-binding protein